MCEIENIIRRSGDRTEIPCDISHRQALGDVLYRHIKWSGQYLTQREAWLPSV